MSKKQTEEVEEVDLVYNHMSAEVFQAIYAGESKNGNGEDNQESVLRAKLMSNRFNDPQEGFYLNKNPAKPAVGAKPLTLDDFFLICFSEESDSLPQWRSYGADGGGFALGFDKAAIKKFAELKGGKFGKVVYIKDVNVNEEIAKEKVMAENEIVDSDEMKGWANFWPLFVKNEAYSGEREYRLVIPCGGESKASDDQVKLARETVKGSLFGIANAFNSFGSSINESTRNEIERDVLTAAMDELNKKIEERRKQNEAADLELAISSYYLCIKAFLEEKSDDAKAMFNEIKGKMSSPKGKWKMYSKLVVEHLPLVISSLVKADDLDFDTNIHWLPQKNGRGLSAYVEIPIGREGDANEGSFLPVRKIIIGPKNESSPRAILAYMGISTMREQSQKKNRDYVRRSKIQYRDSA